jgi:polyisoprenoid-binding protein YceI
VKHRRIWIIAGSIAGVFAIAVFSVWWFVLRSDAPDPVTLEGAVASVTSTTTPSTSAEGSGDGPAPAGTPTSQAETPSGGIEGTWTLTADGRSFAGYRVNEELATIGVTTAAGRTARVAGTLEISANGAAVDVVVDMTALESDDSRRDGAIRRQALETDAFPEASFRTTSPIVLPPEAASGEPITVGAIGDLTLHGVTRTVTITLEAQFVDGVIVVVGSLAVEFADYGIEAPRAAVVLSVEDRGVMEFQLVFVRP